MPPPATISLDFEFLLWILSFRAFFVDFTLLPAVTDIILDPIGPPNIYFVSLLATRFLGAEAMPLAPVSADDRKRAGDCAAVRLQADRIIRQETRTNRDRLLEAFDYGWPSTSAQPFMNCYLLVDLTLNLFLKFWLLTDFFFCNLLKFTVFFLT
jgi:hypothetical protein